MLEICTGEGGILLLRAVPLRAPTPDPDPTAAEAARQAGEYLRGERTAFTVPFRLTGTPFRISVWRALAAVPRGETRTYGEIAAAIGRPGAARAVGRACGQNPLWFIIPCHRVVAAGGKLGGYAGGRELKERLLRLEGAWGDLRTG